MATADNSTRLAQRLEGVTEKSLDWLDEVLSTPIDTKNGQLLRAQASAAMTALNTQLRADALRLRAQRIDNALEKLIETIRRKEITTPAKDLDESRIKHMGSLP